MCNEKDKNYKNITCLNRFLGLCPQCIENYDPNNRPNNFDCPRFQETSIIVFDVKKDINEDK